MRTAPFLALAVALALASPERAPAQPKGKVLTPAEIYAQFRETMASGKFDIASIYLDQFVKADPTDADLLKLQEQYGSTVFQQLRTVPRYSDDPATEKAARANIEELNKRASAAAAKVLYNPERVRKYVRNLGESYEEQVFAQQELKRTGDFAVPYLVEAIVQNPSPTLYAGILETIPVLEPTTVAGWLAATDILGPDRKFGVLNAIGRRKDAFALLADAQTDVTPLLWRELSRDPKSAPANLRALAANLLAQLYPGTKPDTARPEVELLAHARKFYDHKARYTGAKVNPNATPATVPLWVAEMDGVVPKLTKLPEVPVGQAEEYFGLRYARWALESNPDYRPAQSLIVALVAERAAERAGYAPLATAEPAAYKLLSDAPSETLGDLLSRGLNEKRTPLVLATVQLLGDRADRLAATPTAGVGGQPALLVKALTYPDHAVQFAAAAALLRAPVPVPADARPLIVETLRRALAADPGAPGEAKGTALVADPNRFRAEATAGHLRALGYTVEQFPTGRELLRRVARASDFDLLFVDRHAANPELLDLVAVLQTDHRAAARPLYVIASGDKPRPPTFDQLVLRVAALIAATDNDLIEMPLPFVPDPRAPFDENISKKRQTQELRDKVFRAAASARSARLTRVLDTLPLKQVLNEEQARLLNARAQLIVYALLDAEFPLTRDASPDTFAEVERVRKLIATQPQSATYGAGLSSEELVKLIERFELDVARVPAAQARYDMLRSKVDPVALGLPVETFRDPALEAKLTKALAQYPGAKVLAEPSSRLVFEAEFKTLFADPMMLPRSAAVKKADARAAAGFFARMATGELPGFDLRTAEADLRAALLVPDLAPAAIDAVAALKSGESQVALLQYALGGETRPVTQRLKAADAALRHIRAHGSAVPASLAMPLGQQADSEPNAELRGKFLVIKGIVSHSPAAFVDALKAYNPPILPPAPKKEPDKAGDPKKEADPKM